MNWQQTQNTCNIPVVGKAKSRLPYIKILQLPNQCHLIEGTHPFFNLTNVATSASLLNITEASAVRLPQEKQLLLVRLNKIFEIAIEAIDHFLQGNLHFFDPHVGETSCQVRAYMIQMLYLQLGDKREAYLSYKSMLNTSLKKLNDAKTSPPITSKKECLAMDILSNCSALFHLPMELKLLTHAYLLTRFSICSNYGISEKINEDLLADFFQSSKEFSRKFTRKTQRFLADISCQFILDLVTKTPSLKDYLPLFKGQLYKSDYNRAVLPAFVSMDLILSNIKQQRGLMLVKCHLQAKYTQRTYVFLFVGNTKKFISITQDEASSLTPMFSLTCISNMPSLPIKQAFKQLNHHISTCGIDQLLLANMAAHPQYSGRTLAPYRYQLPISTEYPYLSQKYQEKFQKFWNMAHELGCHINDSSCILLKHAYCECIDHVFGKHPQYQPT